MQLICIVCTRKCKEFNHKRRVRTQRNRFKFVKSSFTGDLEKQRMRQTETRSYGQIMTVLMMATEPLENHGIDRSVTKKSGIEEAGEGKNGFPLLSRYPFFLRWWLYSFFERRYLLNVLNLGFGEVTSFWVETNDFIFNDSYKAFNTTVTSMTIKNCYKFTVKNQNNN